MDSASSAELKTSFLNINSSLLVKFKLNLENEMLLFKLKRSLQDTAGQNTESAVALRMPVFSVSSQHFYTLFSITYENL